MISKSNAISDNIDDLLNNLNNVSLRLDISKNEFQSLRNVQFIESRVYEEDETLETPTYNDSKVIFYTISLNRLRKDFYFRSKKSHLRRKQRTE